MGSFLGRPAPCERRLIEDNLNRRRLAPLELARCSQRLKELGRRGGLCQQEKAELRDRIGMKLGMSGRNLDRYLRVLQGTPQEAQDAVSSGALAVTVAERVAGLKKATREQVAEEIRAGQDPAEAVRRHAPKGTGRHKKARHAIDAFLLALERGVNDLQGRVDSIGIRLSAREAATLHGAEAIIRAIRQRAAVTAAAAPAAQAAP
jgi:hypothetical protein